MDCSTPFKRVKRLLFFDKVKSTTENRVENVSNEQNQSDEYHKFDLVAMTEEGYGPSSKSFFESYLSSHCKVRTVGQHCADWSVM